MRVLGVDPGLTRCGVGIVEHAPGSQRLRMVHVGVVRTPSTDDVAVRLLAVSDAVEALLEEFRPDRVALERMFNRHNVSTIMGTAQAAGVVAAAGARRGLPVAWHTPTEVKAAVSGNGAADKAQVTSMVTRLLRLTEPPRPADAADALALAICHLWRAPMKEALDRAALAARAGATNPPGSAARRARSPLTPRTVAG